MTLAMILSLGSILGLIGLLYLWRRLLFDRQRKRSPITRDMLRAPGTHARETIAALQLDIDSWLVPIFMVPGYFVAAVYGHMLDTGEASLFLNVLAVVAVLTICGGAFFKLIKLVKQKRNWVLGLDAELAVAQELDLLMLDGYRVFHDFPADNFNIDHIVIGKNGVFAVETKGRAKQISDDGKSQWKVDYDGRSLAFPRRTETAPLDQAQRQADWLAKWLTGAVGEQVSALPVLMLPGWYISRTSSSGMPVLNATGSRKIFATLKGRALSTQQIQRIAFQVEAKCRDQKPQAYAPTSTKQS